MSEQQTRRIKIIHDGSMDGVNARVIDAETGEPIRYVRRVEVVLDARGAAEAVIYLHAPDVEIVVNAAIAENERSQDERIANAVVKQLRDFLVHLLDRQAGS